MSLMPVAFNPPADIECKCSLPFSLGWQNANKGSWMRKSLFWTCSLRVHYSSWWKLCSVALPVLNWRSPEEWKPQDKFFSNYDGATPCNTIVYWKNICNQRHCICLPAEHHSLVMGFLSGWPLVVFSMAGSHDALLMPGVAREHWSTHCSL